MTKENQYRAMIGYACFTLGALSSMALSDSTVDNVKELFADELKAYQIDLVNDTEEGKMHHTTAEYYIHNMQVTIEELEAQPSIEPSIYEQNNKTSDQYNTRCSSRSVDIILNSSIH